MIFATVGTQLPFNRLISTLDDWASDRAEVEVFAQIGVSSFQPRSIRWSRFLEPQDFARQMSQASVIVAHAGIGSIISALELGKPIIILPRLAEHGEHRNDHQLATAKRFQDTSLVSVAFNKHELRSRLDDVDSIDRHERIQVQASPHLIRQVHQFIHATH